MAVERKVSVFVCIEHMKSNLHKGLQNKSIVWYGDCLYVVLIPSALLLSVGGFKGGKNVIIEPHRHEGVFIARGKEDALVTLNMVPGEAVYGEKRISVEVSNSCRCEVWSESLGVAQDNTTAVSTELIS